MIIGSLAVLGYTNLDYSNPQDDWLDLVISLNQSGNNFTIDNINGENISDTYLPYTGALRDVYMGAYGMTTYDINVTGGIAVFNGSLGGESALGYDNVRIGTYINTPRIIFEDGNRLWEIDHIFAGGISALRIYTPLVTQVTFTDGHTIFNGNITVKDNISCDYMVGDVIGDVTGNLTGNVTGDLIGNVTGNVVGAITNTNAPAQCPANTGMVYHNGSNSICTQAIGYWVTDTAGITPVDSNHNVTVNNLFVNNSIYIGDSDDDAIIYFYDDVGTPSPPQGEFFMWNDTISHFVTSNTLDVTGHLHVKGFMYADSDIFTSGDNDDLYLGEGITGQEDSDFKAYANGKLNITGPFINDGYMSIGTNSLFGNITRGFDNLINDVGDVVIGNRLFTENMIMAFAPAYGPALMAHEYGSNLSIISLGYTATLDADTQYICDSEDPFLSSHEMSMLTVVYSNPSYTDATGMITDFVNSTCVRVSFGSANRDEIVSATDMTYYVYPHPIYAALDNGDIHFKIGNSPDARMHIWVPNGTGVHGVYIEDAAGADQHKSLTIDTDINNKQGIIGFNSFMYSSVSVPAAIRADNMKLEMDATNINLSELVFISTSIIGTPSKTTKIDFAHVDPAVTHIIHMGSPDILAKIYDNGLDISDVRTGTPHTIFNADNDVLYMGDTDNFTIMTFSLLTPSSANVLLNYYYCNTSGLYEPLMTSLDTTGGFTVSGTISFTAMSDRGVCNQQLNGTPFAETTNLTYIALERTRNNLVTPPTIDDITASGSGTHFILQKNMLKLNPTDTAPETCNAEWLGAIYFDISEDDMCQCKSTGWKEITGGGACT